MKKLGLTLLVIIGILAIVSAFLPGKIRVERSVLINAPVKSIFDQVNTLTNWKNWSFWDNIDPNMKSEYEGPVSGTGAIHKWRSKNDSVGTGSLTIVESTEPNTIITALNFEGMGTSNGGWTFDDTGEGVRTTIFMDIEVPFYGRIFPGLKMDDWLGKDFDKSLANLKVYVEGLPVEKPATPAWQVDTLTTFATPALSMKVTVPTKEISAKLGEVYGKILESISKQGLRQSGSVFAIYHKYSPEQVELEPGIPVDKPGKEDGDVKPIVLPAVKAMKLDYMGEYSNMEKAYKFLDDWAAQNKVTVAGAPWEEYVTDPMSEPDTSKWLTRIYYPIQ